MAEETNRVIPSQALQQVAEAIPEDCRKNMVIVGSLAAGYYFFGGENTVAVRTKDADCLLSPRVQAIDAGIAIANRLIEDNWEYHPTEEFPEPGNEETGLDRLPVVRLKPPGQTEWFIELLTVPEGPQDLGKKYIRLPTSHGHFSLCSFGFLALTDFKPIKTPFGIGIARPEMMALANLLHHPEIEPETMTGLIAGRQIKRSNKDLGRVLSLGYLAEVQNEDSLLAWGDAWAEALQDRFPEKWKEFGARAGSGLRVLLDDRNLSDFDEAYHTCANGLLSSRNELTPDALRVTGERIIVDAVEALEKGEGISQPFMTKSPDDTPSR